MTNRWGYIVLAAASFILVSAPQARAQYDPNTSPFDTYPEPKKQAPPRPVDIYVKKIAEYFNTKQDEVIRLANRGYGRNELIKLLLIVQGSHKNLRDIARMRDKSVKFSAIAAKYDLDYDAILTEAQEVREKIDRAIAAGLPNAGTGVSNGNATVSSSTGTTVAPVPAVRTSTSTEKTNE